MNEKVISLYGQLTGERKVVESAVGAIADWSAKVQSGEAVAVVVVGIYHDGLAGYTVAGKLGGYSVLGAMEMARQYIIDINKAAEKK